MTTSSELRRARRPLLLACVLAAVPVGCGLERHAELPTFDCAAIDRAEERFPDVCDTSASDAGAAVDDGAADGGVR